MIHELGSIPIATTKVLQGTVQNGSSFYRNKGGTRELFTKEKRRKNYLWDGRFFFGGEERDKGFNHTYCLFILWRMGRGPM